MGLQEGSEQKLARFCTQALHALGAGVYEESPGVWSVSVPSALIELFEGQPQLRLTFSPDCVGDDIELVVPGSYVLERLLESIRKYGSLGNFHLCPMIDTSSSPAFNLQNAQTQFVSDEAYYRVLVMLVYRISLITDENEDRLFSVIIDPATGERVDMEPDELLAFPTHQPTSSQAETAFDPSNAFASGRKEAEQKAKEWAQSLQRGIDMRLDKEFARLDQYYQDLLEDATKTTSQDLKKLQRFKKKSAASYDEAKRVFDIANGLLTNSQSWESFDALVNERRKVIVKEIQSTAWKPFADTSYTKRKLLEWDLKLLNLAADESVEFAHLPIKLKLERFEQKRKQSLDDMQRQVETQEEEKFGNVSEDQLSEIGTQLNSEKAQRIAELKDKFHLKVVITPVNASIFHYPMMECHYSAEYNSTTASFTTKLDMITGDIAEQPSCRFCGAKGISHLCSGGHLVCANCIHECAGCGECICPSCQTEICPICGKRLCSDCVSNLHTCGECGIKGCKNDVIDCPSCAKTVCLKHSLACRFCSQSHCAACIDASGYCKTCRSLFPATFSASAIEQIISELTGKPLPVDGRWFVGENIEHFVLMRNGFYLKLYVVDKSSHCLISHNQFGLWRSLKEKMRILKG